MSRQVTGMFKTGLAVVWQVPGDTGGDISQECSLPINIKCDSPAKWISPSFLSAGRGLQHY